MRLCVGRLVSKRRFYGLVPAQKFQAQQVARLSLGANVFLVVIKVGAGWQSGSLSVLAEGVQSLLDIVASAS
ncbi:MAG: hypothetical protein KY445_02835 [Armatimonadetes bacterium]|nr:hypothetical protein [Armatimonadota bacterium]